MTEKRRFRLLRPSEFENRMPAPFLFDPFIRVRGGWCVVVAKTSEQVQWFTEAISFAASGLGLGESDLLVFDFTESEVQSAYHFNARLRRLYEPEALPTRFYFVRELDFDDLGGADLVLEVTDDLVYVEKSRDALRPEEPLSRREWLHFHGPRAV